MMQEKRVYFKNHILPYWLLAPQLTVTFFFFLWPAAQSIISSFQREDPFGFKTVFVGFDNYIRIFSSPSYYHSIYVTVIFAISVTVLSMVLSLLLAVAADRVIKAKSFFTTMLLWPYAVAPLIAGVLWLFLFNPTIGTIPHLLNLMNIKWNHLVNGTQAMIFITIAASWKQISYNFLFFLAGLQSIPKSQIEAAAIDGAGPIKRFWTIVFPQLSPTTFFLLIININYVMFDTFAIIAGTTEGGPAQSTNTLVYKVFDDGFTNHMIGISAAQSTILMILVIALTVFQFRFVERRVQY